MKPGDIILEAQMQDSHCPTLIQPISGFMFQKQADMLSTTIAAKHTRLATVHWLVQLIALVSSEEQTVRQSISSMLTDQMPNRKSQAVAKLEHSFTVVLNKLFHMVEVSALVAFKWSFYSDQIYKFPLTFKSN